MAPRFLWRATRKLALVGTVVAGGAGAAVIASSDDPATALKLCTTVPVRLTRLSLTAASIAYDYKYSLWGLPEDSIERMKTKHEVHVRSACKLEELCCKNGGIYIKLGQHISQLEYIVPQEYVVRMRESLLNRCPVSSYDEVCEVVKKELGGMPDEIFDEFDPVPVASASLAQVHAARTHGGEKVAVKVQHAHMTDTAAADYATVELVVNTLHRFFPTFDYRWLIDEVGESLPQELDFVVEGKNSEKCLDNFRKLSPHIADYVYVPRVYWSLSTSKVLTMEFMDAAQINDVQQIRRLGIQPNDVVKLVSQTFAEMMFKHGFVHCDPHVANLLIRPLPHSKRSILGVTKFQGTLEWFYMYQTDIVLVRSNGRSKPQLVLLDHGLYKILDFSTRTNYAALWKALIFADVRGIKENCKKLGAGDDLYALFAGVLTMRPWNRVTDRSVDHLALQGTDDDISELQMYASEYFLQISELLRRLPRVILLMMKTNDCLRAVNNSLLKGSSLETFLIIGRVSSEAVIEAKMPQSKFSLRRISIWAEKKLLDLRLFAMQIALWVLQLKRVLSLQSP